MKPVSHSALPYHRKNPTFDIPDLGAPIPVRTVSADANPSAARFS